MQRLFCSLFYEELTDLGVYRLVKFTYFWGDLVDPTDFVEATSLEGTQLQL